MIESYAYEAMKSIAAAQKDTPNKLAICLGDQKPTGYCGFETARHPVGRDFNRYPLTAHTFYVGVRTGITPLTWPSQRKYPKA